VRQFFTLRFWLTIAALLGLALAAVAVAGAQDDDQPTPEVVGEGRSSRRMDLVSWAYVVIPAEGFAMVDGRTTADLAVQIDGTRTMRIAAGTEGEIDCPGLSVPGRCVVAADLLGDAVLWFSIIEGAPSPTLTLPAVREILDDGWVLLENGWEVRHADVVDRLCDDESASLTEFIRTYGESATSTFNVEQQQIVRVTCPKVTPTTSTTVDAASTTTLFDVSSTTVPPGDESLDDEAG